MSTRTVDELSEMEEFIDLACRKAGPKMGRVTRGGGGTWCPLQAAGNVLVGLPLWIDGGIQLGLSAREREEFYVGYDRGYAGATPLGAMGARFRARVEAGEYHK